MAYSADYQKWVLDDIRSYRDIVRPVKSSVITRLFVKKLPVNMLHPNPEDEFCDPKIGPNEGIVSNYIATFARATKRGQKPEMGKLIVEKMSTGGYMLLNGHHRWMPAVKMHLASMPVSIVNTSVEEEIIAKLNQSEKIWCVSFDLDEVLLTDCGSDLAERKLPIPYRFIFKKTLRKKAAALIGELQRLGFDVWVYSGSAISEEEINRLMSLHGVKVNGIVSFVKGKKTSNVLKQEFRKKYALSVHIDNESVVWVNTSTHDYDSIAIDSGANWADDAFTTVHDLDAVKAGEKKHE